MPRSHSTGSSKKILFSLTKKDFIIQTFCTGGPGGQKQNSTESGVRIIHPASGASGEGREFRHQAQNRKVAFERMANSKKFKKWHSIEVARRMGQLQEVERAVEAAMDDKNFKIEYF